VLIKRGKERTIVTEARTHTIANREREREQKRERERTKKRESERGLLAWGLSFLHCHFPNSSIVNKLRMSSVGLFDLLSNQLGTLKTSNGIITRHYLVSGHNA
jgi:hypothetical protein